MKTKPPPDFSDGDSLLSVERFARAKRLQSGAYFAQQGILIRQQLPPPQQSAELEVALAVPTSARAAMIANRYFIEILL
jgi:hypothetical protein